MSKKLKSNGHNKDCRLETTVTPEQFQQIALVAQRSGVSIAAFVRNSSLMLADRLLNHERELH